MPTLDEGLADWFQLHPARDAVWKLPDLSPKASGFVNNLWPMGMAYHSPLKPRFLIELENAGLPAGSETFLIRDGLIPLLWFWRKWPEPREFQGKILIGEQFAPYVPPAWRERVLFYRLTAGPRAPSLKSTRAPKSAKRRILLVGLVMPGYCSLESLKKKLAPLKKTRAEVVAFLPVRFGQSTVPRLAFHFKFVQEVCRTFPDVECIDWGAVDSMQSWAGTEVLDLSDGMILNDNSLMHSVLSSGASLLGGGAQSGGRYIPVSPYHGYVISERVGKTGRPLDEDRLEAMIAIGQAMRSDANQHYPWPTWFDDFCEVR